MRTINGLKELFDLEGQEIGVSDWHEVTQADIDTFGKVTDDEQWIHCDPVRAAETPFGGTIAHGYYTLSLAPKFTGQVMRFEGFAFALNYGLDKVRFPAALPVGAKVRASVKLSKADEIPGGAHVKFELTFEREGGDKPVCVAETLARMYTA